MRKLVENATIHHAITQSINSLVSAMPTLGWPGSELNSQQNTVTLSHNKLQFKKVKKCRLRLHLIETVHRQSILVTQGGFQT